MYIDREDSFLVQLFRKKAAVIQASLKTGRPLDAAVQEVDRQIKQAMTGGDPIKGEGVTKSGPED